MPRSGMRCAVGIAFLIACRLAVAFSAAANPPEQLPLEWNDWVLDESARLTSGDPAVLQVSATRQNQSDNAVHGATVELDLAPYAGRTLEFKSHIRGKNITKPTKPYGGMKFMLKIQSDAGVSYPAAGEGFCGSFDRREFSFCVTIPPSVKAAKLVLGLQCADGEVEFDLPEIRQIRLYEPIELPENFRCEYSEAVRHAARRRGFMSPNLESRGLTDDDLSALESWGADLVRYQINPSPSELNDSAKYLAAVRDRLDELDELLELKPNTPIKFIIDLHQVPGGRYKLDGTITDRGNEFKMFYDDEYFETFVRIWEYIARRYRGNPHIFGYDLANEPVQDHRARRDYLTTQFLAAQAIRRIDPEIPIFVSSNRWNSPEAFDYLQPLPLKNIIYQLHMYEPHQYTHQGVGAWLSPSIQINKTSKLKYPGFINRQLWNAARLAGVLRPAAEFQRKFGAEMYLGEFSAIRWAPGAERYIEDVIDFAEAHSWHWTFHAFREYHGWDIEYGPDPAQNSPSDADNPRRAVLIKHLKSRPVR